MFAVARATPARQPTTRLSTLWTVRDSASPASQVTSITSVHGFVCRLDERVWDGWANRRGKFNVISITSFADEIEFFMTS